MIKFKNICPNLKNLWFTSDLHRSHKNLCLGTTSWEGESKNGCRNFSSVEEMDKTIVDNINKYVKEDDVLIHCGDWSFSGEDNIEILRNEINCKNVYGIQGNHDHLKYNAIYEKIFKEYNQISYYSCEGVKFICTHYPIFHWHEQNKGVISVHGHCLDIDTELLTTNGWKKYDNIQLNDKVYSLTNSGIVESEITKIIINNNYNGYMYDYDTNRISLSVTDLHRFVEKENNKISYKTADTFFNEGGNIVLTDSINLPEYPISDNLIRLYIQLVTDGSLIIKTQLCRINLKKERKIYEVEKLLNNLDIKYTKNYQKNNMCCFNFKLPNELSDFKIKGLDTKILKFSERQVDIIAETYSITDGCINGNSIVIHTSKFEEVEILQQLFSINNYKTNKYSRVHGFSKNLSYILRIIKDNKKLIYTNKYSFRKNSFKKYKADNKIVWCLSTNEGNFLCRRKGKTYFTGNCHSNESEILKQIHQYNSLDVGIDNAFKMFGIYRPYSALEICNILKSKSIIEHHEDRK